MQLLSQWSLHSHRGSIPRPFTQTSSPHSSASPLACTYPDHASYDTKCDSPCLGRFFSGWFGRGLSRSNYRSCYDKLLPNFLYLSQRHCDLAFFGHKVFDFWNLARCSQDSCSSNLTDSTSCDSFGYLNQWATCTSPRSPKSCHFYSWFGLFRAQTHSIIRGRKCLGDRLEPDISDSNYTYCTWTDCFGHRCHFVYSLSSTSSPPSSTPNCSSAPATTHDLAACGYCRQW